MASTSVPCPKTSFISRIGSNVSNPLPRPSVSFSSRGFQWPNRKQSAVTIVKAQLNEAIVKDSSNSVPVLDSNSKNASPEVKDEPVKKTVPDAATIAAFMEQASDLVKLVDSRDITELQLKQLDCELTIRKKEALQPPPVVAMPPSYQHTVLPPPPPAAPAPPPAPQASAPVRALPAPTKAATSSHPPLKCPMAGTFYRSPAPGEPQFVKVGDKVQKGQVVCIIEAMKLMNEIEADQSGTITEILVEDGKPVSVDTPLFVIVP